MNPIKKVLLTVLTVLPSASISMVAHAKLLECAGEDQSNQLEDEAVKARRLLMPLGAMSTTTEDAKKLLSEQTGIKDEKSLEDEFQKQVQILVDKGVVQKDEKMLMSSGPSRWF